MVSSVRWFPVGLEIMFRDKGLGRMAEVNIMPVRVRIDLALG